MNPVLFSYTKFFNKIVFYNFMIRVFLQNGISDDQAIYNTPGADVVFTSTPGVFNS